MKIVVDTNIVFSGILNPTSRIGRILISSNQYIQFYSCTYLKVELLKHGEKLVKITKSTPEIIAEIQSLVIARISFIHENLISEMNFVTAESLLQDVDVNDTPFVALAMHLEAQLWTGDKLLYNGLKKQGFSNILNTHEVLEIIEQLENR